MRGSRKRGGVPQIDPIGVPRRVKMRGTRGWVDGAECVRGGGTGGREEGGRVGVRNKALNGGSKVAVQKCPAARRSLGTIPL